ncbi:hypothetical protein HD599_000023 [Conyzicola lurida]|uniref:Uncharacterized protein n=1 Tax=Conyzicola lurida TaxID=1172621 RepID=A0A841ADC6_9MICO|nr:hypothetical protein [Conyzicola lurida]
MSRVAAHLAYRMTRTQGWLMAATSGLLLAIGALNLVVNTLVLGSWLPLILSMIYPFVLGVASIRKPRMSPEKS